MKMLNIIKRQLNHISLKKFNNKIQIAIILINALKHKMSKTAIKHFKPSQKRLNNHNKVIISHNNRI